MTGFKSVSAGGQDSAKQIAALLEPLVTAQPRKFYWFLKNGYRPHGWQILFHFARSGEKATRFRHLVAGRRGGKTLSAAWEILFYCVNPADYHMDFHGVESSEPLWVWGLAKDYKLGRPQLLTFLKVMTKAGLVKDRDYKYNKTEKNVEFPDGTLVEFKSADDPQSLRGPGLHLLWLDEAAFIPSAEAYRVVRPALSDTLGGVITTTTPQGKNWLYDEFWSAKSLADPQQFRVEYTTLDSPFIDRDEVSYARETMHPSHFKQEYMASFDAFQGVELQGEWLKFYSVGVSEHPEDIRLPKPVDGKLPLRTYMAVDPAISLADTADHFAMALIGVTLDFSQAFLLDTYKARIEFPDQLDKIREWFLKYRPEYIGIEGVAYQRALSQQASRMEGLPPIVPILSRSGQKKADRILGMSPLFKTGRIRIHRANHVDFMEEWLNYDSQAKNPKDDLLDAVETAIVAAGILLPSSPHASHFSDQPFGGGSMEDEALATLAFNKRAKASAYADPELGSDA